MITARPRSDTTGAGNPDGARVLDTLVSDIVCALGDAALSSIVSILDGVLPVVSDDDLAQTIGRLSARGILSLDKGDLWAGSPLRGEVRLRAGRGCPCGRPVHPRAARFS